MQTTRMTTQKTLIMCRTPFQAAFLKRIIPLECASRYDLIYFTQDNAEEDVTYFRELAVSAELASYVYVKRQRFDILNHFKFFFGIDNNIRKNNYSKVILSSFDNLSMRRLATKSAASEIITFDDGAGYISNVSAFVIAKHHFREAVYAALFQASTRHSFIKRVARHYSIYPGFVNIMPADIVRYISFFPSVRSFDARTSRGIKIFVGGPFEEIYDGSHIANLKDYVKDIKLDYYLKHPRESIPIIADTPVLRKGGKIAEDVIFKVGIERRITLMGAFSSVLLNVPADFADKIMVLEANNKRDRYLAELGERAGCTVVFI